jgi:phage terminase large subunit-like protein
MTPAEHRKFIRYDSLHLLDYLVFDDEGNPGVYSMGRTIDVSVDGLKLETSQPLKANTQLAVTVGIEDDLIELQGRTTHAHPFNGRFLSGITFVKISKEGRRIFAKYVEAFRQRQNERLSA